MKQLFTVVLCLIFCSAFGQNKEKVERLNFCGKEFKVPAGCQAKSEYEISCDDYSIIWVYMPNNMLTSYPEQTMNLLASRMENFTKTPITGYLLGSPAQGYKISYNTSTGTARQVIAYGQVNGQAVLVQLLVHTNPTSNADIPEFPKQIFRFTK